MHSKPKFPAHVLWPNLLELAGKRFYGRAWRKHVAELVKVDRKVIDRWMKEGAPGWVCAQLLKVGFEKSLKVTEDETSSYAEITKIANVNDALWSQWGAYRKYKKLGPLSPIGRAAQVAKIKLPIVRK